MAFPLAFMIGWKLMRTVFRRQRSVFFKNTHGFHDKLHIKPTLLATLHVFFKAFRWYNHRDVKKQTEPQSLQSDRISPFLCRECGLIYLQAATLMLQFKVRHYDPSQQLNRKMAAFPNGCGHFLFPIYITLRKWYNNRGRFLSWPHFRFKTRGACGHFQASPVLYYYYLSIFDIIQSKWPLLTYRGWPTPLFPIKSSLWQKSSKVVYYRKRCCR